MFSGNNKVVLGCLFIIGLLGAVSFLALIAGAAVWVFGNNGLNISLTPGVAILKIDRPIEDSERVLKQLKSLMDDRDTKALVVRVDSPGGSIGDVEEIYRSIKKAAERVPVVASMGSRAASGGYFVCLPARRIFANHSTVTGSIGVMMEFISAEPLLERIGIKMETVASGEMKSLGTYGRSLTDPQREYVQRFVNNFHEFFVDRVAADRNLDLEKVKILADGRLFSGTEARDNGLVDELGNFEDAVEYAAKAAGISDDYDLIEVEDKEGGFRLALTRASLHSLLKLVGFDGGGIRMMVR